MRTLRPSLRPGLVRAAAITVIVLTGLSWQETAIGRTQPIAAGSTGSDTAAPVYPDRHQFSSQAGVVVFSAKSQRIRRSTGMAAPPASPAPISAMAPPPAGPPAISYARQSGPLAITSGFGMRRHPILGIAREHLGVDLAARAGSPILAPAEGTVRLAGWASGYGLTVMVEHGGGLETRYAHLSGIAVGVGQAVHAGTLLGYVGSTGLATGPHLHYEVRVNGRAVNPLGVTARR